MEEFELEPGETILLQIRQHLFVLFLKLLPFILLAIAPFIVAPLFAMFAKTAAGAAVSGDLSPAFRFFIGLWWLFLWMGSFQIITKFFLTSWVITSHRIVDIEQIGFFSRKVSSFLLLRVQDVTTDVRGILSTLIGFGDIHVETAGNHETFYMRNVRSPEYLRDLIMGEVALLHQDGDAKTEA
ncbi:MAG: hypothetical protein QOE22_640 [Candidatus Parcubacteria bacterium]|jgi:uncharacterized membrane protein YdbT with pleckstrin-like domain|nr:hypothetical protein [Candidatus Parcubacteria bacterium]